MKYGFLHSTGFPLPITRYTKKSIQQVHFAGNHKHHNLLHTETNPDFKIQYISNIAGVGLEGGGASEPGHSLELRRGLLT